MKITYYGTAAAEGFPALFCHCDACERARQSGGKNLRSRSQALINDDLLIDFPPDTYMHCLFYGLDLRKVKSCIITHAHKDHLYIEDFQNRMPTYSVFPNNDKDKTPLHLYASKKSGAKLKKLVRELTLRDSIALRYHDIKPFESYEIEGYTVTPLKACHAPDVEPLNFIIQRDGKSILYANDTGYFYPETWEFLEKSGIVFDFVSLDCTLITEDNYIYHMGLENCKKVKERLLKTNADEHTVFCLNHFSHSGQMTYDELVPVAKEMGFLVTYDGFQVEI
ncbi:MAG: MBL fold metallo-hydrolase [Eubacteriales bacterium]|nr:MBL fold metallo-hydrolase [Eubacteriales bacterium]